MRLKYLISLGISIVFFSCTKEETLNDFISSYRNGSNQILSIIGYNSSNLVEFQYTIPVNESSPNCNTQSNTFSGITCGADSIVFKFPNNRGYICDLRVGEDSFCFPNNRTPLIGIEENFNQIDSKTYEFIITESDFENAFDLPD